MSKWWKLGAISKKICRQKMKRDQNFILYTKIKSKWTII